MIITIKPTKEEEASIEGCKRFFKEKTATKALLRSAEYFAKFKQVTLSLKEFREQNE